MDESFDTNMIKQLRIRSKGPSYGVKRYSRFTMDDVIFHYKDRSMMRIFENSGVLCKTDIMCNSSTRDNNTISGEIDYYGVLLDVIQFHYFKNLQVVLFNYLWSNGLSEGNSLKVDEYGCTCVKNINFVDTYESFILASQAKKVFYLIDHANPSWSTILTTEVRK